MGKLGRKENAAMMRVYADMVVHGDDYSDEKQREMYKVPIERGIFRTVPYTKGISTTEIIRRIKYTG